MTTLVTGGSGFLGSEIIQRLLAKGEKVRSYSRRVPSKLKKHPNLEIVLGSVCDTVCLKKALTGCDSVIHTAAKAGVWGLKSDYFSTNVVGTQNILNLSRLLGIRHLVHTSSPSVVYADRDICGLDEKIPYADSFLSHYPLSKKESEIAVLNAHRKGSFQTLALRPHLIWGKEDPHFLPRILKKHDQGSLFQIGQGKNQVDTIHVTNAAEAHLKALSTMKLKPDFGGKAYFIGQEEPVFLWDFLKDLIAATGRKRPKLKKIPYSIARLGGSTFETLYQAIGFDYREPPITRFVASQLAHSHYFDHSMAKKDFGYEVLIKTSQGINELSKHFKSSADKSPQTDQGIRLPV